MRKRHRASGVVVLAFAMGTAWAQDTPGSQPVPPPASGPQNEPAPAYGVENPPLPVSENPPVSGLDLPGLEPHGAPLSYLQPGLHLTESVDSNVGGELGESSVHSVTRALFSLELQRLWSNYKLALDYVGGVGYYNTNGIGFKQIQQLDLDQRITWKRGQLGIRDGFSYLPEGTFGGAYGSMNAEGQMLGGGAFGGQNPFQSGGSLGSLGEVPRIMNLALADLTQNLTPKSSFTMTGGYDFVHFTEDLQNSSTGSPVSFIGSHEASFQVGYNRVVAPHDQLALVYGFQGFDFSVSGQAFHSNVIQVMWAHRISGRMDFTIGAGPQFTEIGGEGMPSSLRITGAGRVLLRYKFPKTTLSAKFSRYNSSGSGFFAGAESNVATLSVHRPLGRVWSVFTDMGYSRNSRQQPIPVGLGVGISANTYTSGFAGVGAHRKMGKDFRVYATYQFNYLSFDGSFCQAVVTGGSCSRVSQRHVGAMGLDWSPRPKRLD